MKVLTLFALLTLPCVLAGIASFELVFGLFLVLPILFYLCASFAADPQQVYYGLLAAIVLVLLLTALYRAVGKRPRLPRREFEGLWVFFAGYLLLEGLTMRWPDFFSIGERLRDYALLSSVISSPVFLKEPWFAGAELNYYGYWYRAGHMLHAFLGMEPWEVYHQLQSVTYSGFLACSYLLFRRWMPLSVHTALLLTIFVGFGSNVAGIQYLFTSGTTWWYPSRVILGAIHEFPVWSFVLGDLHPHFLNLLLIPFFLLTACRLLAAVREPADAVVLLLFAIPLPILWLYAANAWEMPLWVGFLCAGVPVGALMIPWRLVLTSERITSFVLPLPLGLIQPHRLLQTAAILILCIGLFIMSRNFVPIESPIKFVGGEIARSRSGELLLHWGFPLFLIAVGNLLALERKLRAVAAIFLIASLLIFTDALPFLVLLWGVNGARMALQFMHEKKQEDIAWESYSLYLFELIGVAALTFLIVPEVVFLDDPYGGENERMNTIFKIYSGSWLPVHAFGFYLIARAYYAHRGRKPSGMPAQLLLTTVVAVFCAFFFVASKERATPETGVLPRARGLGRIEALFPGSADTIRALDGMFNGVVLEAQGPPYSETTHVATLSHNPAYLGWANHVRLLYPSQGDEITRRENMTREFYTNPDCSVKQQILEQEGIQYAVVGPLERRAHPELVPDHFGCLKKVVEHGEYVVFVR